MVDSINEKNRDFLEVEKIVVLEDIDKQRAQQQSKCTCNFIFKDNKGKEYRWVVKNEHLSAAIKNIGLNEEKKYGDLPRIELFAREKTGGWDVFGLETDKFNQK